MSIFLVWAYHRSVDAQSSSFPQHPNDARGVMQQTLIPAAITTTPTPGRTVHSRREKKKKFDEWRGVKISKKTSNKKKCMRLNLREDAVKDNASF